MALQILYVPDSGVVVLVFRILFEIFDCLLIVSQITVQKAQFLENAFVVRFILQIVLVAFDRLFKVPQSFVAVGQIAVGQLAFLISQMLQSLFKIRDRLLKFAQTFITAADIVVDDPFVRAVFQSLLKIADCFLNVHIVHVK